MCTCSKNYGLRLAPHKLSVLASLGLARFRSNHHYATDALLTCNNTLNVARACKRISTGAALFYTRLYCQPQYIAWPPLENTYVVHYHQSESEKEIPFDESRPLAASQPRSLGNQDQRKQQPLTS